MRGARLLDALLAYLFRWLRMDPSGESVSTLTTQRLMFPLDPFSKTRAEALLDPREPSQRLLFLVLV